MGHLQEDVLSWRSLPQELNEQQAFIENRFVATGYSILKARSFSREPSREFKNGYHLVNEGGTSEGPQGWVNIESGGASPEEACDDAEGGEDAFAKWLEMAAGGELDFFTCWSLSHGREQWNRDAVRLTPGFIWIVVLQLLVPSLMLSHAIHMFQWGTPLQSAEFRLMGFILFLYSTRNMYEGASDECRTQFIHVAFHYQLPWAYLWPALCGEIANAFAGFALVISLFTVFCTSIHPQDLVINCLAINFIVAIDNEFADPEMRDNAVGDFKHLHAEHIGDKQAGAPGGWRCMLHFFISMFVPLMKEVGILSVGFIFAAVFVVAQQDLFCAKVDSQWLREMRFC